MAEKAKKFNILFVCTGNTCRSPMAEFLFKDYLKQKGESSGYAVSSAGLYATRGDVLSAPADRALTVLGIKHTAKKARALTAGMAMDADMVIAMSDRHAAECGDGDNVYSFEEFSPAGAIADPYGGSVDDYLACAAQMRACFDTIYECIRQIKSRK